ncbi:hypothetical protein BD324DRAFT_172355 [Kockovaella imperatae]|uniref:Phorbol-ester/DAG-type domain-containing protein n=1 Tax=Kockovaella imperatae TaxID=4999 RepID=A0A1Y1U874_9TREE|nr:hypothetical protein BD324DRAFT_172355 [Kockovaella imperatae]ORX34213.1 hypothetical protein BD324DRAFT_172355 [Kockovaella imperatae]
MDSVPFLRRLSMDSRRPDSSVIFPRYGEGTRPNSMALTASRPASIAVASEMSEEDLRAVFRQNLHSPNLQFASRVPTPESTPRKNHKLIKTTFSNAILCRVCHANVKKSGLLCQTCGMICHTTCATKAGMTCDVKLQLVLLARQEEMLSMAGLETTTSFHSPQSTQTRGQRGASSPAPMSPAEDADHDNETIGAGKLFAGLRARRESAKGPSRIRRLSRRSSKAVPDDLTAAECFSAEPSEHRRDNATRFQTEMRHLHHHEGVASSAATKSQNNLQIDVLPASSRELEPSGKSDCSIM